MHLLTLHEYPCLCFYLVLLVGSLIILILRYRNIESTANIPPGSQALPLIGETMQFMAAINSSKGFYDFVRVRRIRYENCFKTNIFGKTNVFVSSTESAKVILNNDLGKFTKGYIRSIAELFDELIMGTLQAWEHRGIVVVLNEALKAGKRIMGTLEKMITLKEKRLRSQS
ncbi:hypothetical protein Patl1_09187 [Pistacia atlantica]|uniref:Uncharacterized protein n=1 Tax=Pistacia atlantica TaxID=434234 RepID=A0ACC1AL88_9ROSI|nr:hypothetical protein Patl1_09187 [Pistacia atlantica]